MVDEKTTTAADARLENQHLHLQPIDPLQAMVENDHKQNQRLSRKFSMEYTAELDSQADNDKDGRPRPKSSENNLPGPVKVTRFRFLVCTLGVISLSMSQMSRMVLNLSITQMVDPGMLATRDDASPKVSLDGSCPWPEDQEDKLQAATTAVYDPMYHLITAKNYDDEDQNLNELQDLEDVWEATTQLPQPSGLPPDQPKSNSTSDTLQPTTNVDDRFKWDMRQQNILLGGFYYSYFVFMILGGRMAEMYGAKYVLFLSVAGSALINLATPWMARTSFSLLVMSRVAMGAIQSGVMPGMYALIARWLTMSEASIYTPMIKMNLRLGMALGSMVPGFFSSWTQVFYFTGALNAIWSLLWLLLATSTPAENKWVSEGEVKHINRKKKQLGGQWDQGGNKQESKKTPWLKIITAPSVVGLIIVKLTMNYAIDFLAIELPSYLKYVHHASKERISAITTFMFSIQVVLIVFVGWLAKVLIQRRPLGMDKTFVRKVFQSAASIGMAVTMFAITFNDCNLTYVAIVLQITSFLSMFSAGGEAMLPYDLSEDYPATIMAIANSIANVTAITTTTLAGLILGDQGGSYERWNILIYLIVCANLVGGSAFLLLVRAEPIDFSSKKTRQQLGPRAAINTAVIAAKSSNNSEAAQYDIEMQTGGSFEKDNS